MKSKGMTLMVIAIGCGLAAALLVAHFTQPTGPELIEVWVAKKELKVGTALATVEKDLDEQIEVKKLPQELVAQDAVKSKSDLRGKRLNRTLRAGNPFTPSDVSTDAAVKLPIGMRQYAIKSDVVRSAGGSVEAGKNVDIVFTESMANGKKKASMIYQNMLILQVDQSGRPSDGAAIARSNISSVSLAVTPKQGLTLAAAEERGKLTLLLRDDKSIDSNELTSISLIDGHDNESKSADVKGKSSSADPEKGRYFLQIINNKPVWFLQLAVGSYRRLETVPEPKYIPSDATEDKKDKKPPENSGDNAK